jgi:hypothetical protein
MVVAAAWLWGERSTVEKSLETDTR